MWHLAIIWYFECQSSILPLYDDVNNIGSGNSSSTYRLHKTEQSLLIPLPFWVKLGLWGEFVAAELHGDLKTISVQIVEVWHTCKGDMCIMSAWREVRKECNGSPCSVKSVVSHRQQNCTTKRHWWCPWSGKRRPHTDLCHCLTWWRGRPHKCEPAAWRPEIICAWWEGEYEGLPINPQFQSPILPPYLLIWSGREHLLLVHISREVKGIGDHQLPAVKAGRLDEGQCPDPLHHCVGLWCHLQPKGRIGLFWDSGWNTVSNRDDDPWYLINKKTSPYLAKPVCIRDWDMVNAVVPAAAVAVEKGGEVREIAVEVNILGVGPSTDPTIEQMTLKHSGSNS